MLETYSFSSGTERYDVEFDDGEKNGRKLIVGLKRGMWNCFDG